MNVFDEVLTTEPDEIVAGDYVRWRRDLDDYSSALYDLQYRVKLAGNADASLDIDATADGTGFLITLSSATTEALTPGEYDYHTYVVRKSDSARARIETGTLTIVGNFAKQPGDFRSHAKRMLASIEGLLEGRASDAIDNYSIGGRSITKMSVDELTKWRSYYRSEVEAEEQLSTGKGNTFQVTFGRRV